MSVREHYESHLAEHYSWMLGDFDTRLSQSEDFFRSNAVLPGSNSFALDLGAGSGLQSIALARLGYRVRAVDFSETLLAELERRKGTLPVNTVHGDLLNPESYGETVPELVVCMGDTVTHLPGMDVLQSLFANVSVLLPAGGKFILSYRDLSTELRGEQRFIPVRQDENRIFTCFLEYYPGRVRVHDIVYAREGGTWQQRISSYEKLRIPVETMEKLLAEAGLEIIFHSNESGFHYFIARK